MAIETNKIEGDLIVDDTLDLYGMVTGTITVTRKGQLNLMGICGCDLIVKKRGGAVVTGIVGGHVRNRKGSVTIYGCVHGNVVTTEGATAIDDRAIINGQIIWE